jgi:hypothetical protein
MLRNLVAVELDPASVVDVFRGEGDLENFFEFKFKKIPLNYSRSNEPFEGIGKFSVG